ncbi:hypothetical protein HDV00_000564 [Rhizophlyctis rosea]|nr:hypothetical protein HDV00_000564 [Rhizophlyctis rosea]
MTLHSHSHGVYAHQRNAQRVESHRTKKQNKVKRINIDTTTSQLIPYKSNTQSLTTNHLQREDIPLSHLQYAVQQCKAAGVRAKELFGGEGQPTPAWDRLVRHMREGGHIGADEEPGSLTDTDNNTLLFPTHDSFRITSQDRTTLIDYYHHLTSPLLAAQNGLIFHRLNGIWKDNLTDSQPTTTEVLHHPRLAIMYREPVIQLTFRLLNQKFREEYPELYDVSLTELWLLIYETVFIVQFLFMIIRARKKSDTSSLQLLLFLFSHLPNPFLLWMPQNRWSGDHRDFRDVRCGFCFIYSWFMPFWRENVGRGVFRSPPIGARLPCEGGDALALPSFFLPHKMGREWVGELEEVNVGEWGGEIIRALDERLRGWRRWLKREFTETKIGKLRNWLKSRDTQMRI